jgi:hypothetical protein
MSLHSLPSLDYAGTHHDSSAMLSKYPPIPTLDVVSDRNSFALNRSRAAALEKVDRAPFSYVFLVALRVVESHSCRRLFHVKVWFVAGAGFFTDASVQIDHGMVLSMTYFP